MRMPREASARGALETRAQVWRAGAASAVHDGDVMTDSVALKAARRHLQQPTRVCTKEEEGKLLLKHVEQHCVIV